MSIFFVINLFINSFFQGDQGLNFLSLDKFELRKFFNLREFDQNGLACVVCPFSASFVFKDSVENCFIVLSITPK